jgi:hypothetical protein
MSKEAEQTAALAAPLAPPRAIEWLSASLGIKPEAMLQVIKTQCFQGVSPDKVTDHAVAAYVATAAELRKHLPKVNPLIPGFLYAFPTKTGGVQVICGPDLVFSAVNSHPEVTGTRHEYDEDKNGKVVSCTVYIERTGGKLPIIYTAYLDEWFVETSPMWKKSPRHMLYIRAYKHAARQIIHTLPPDEDEIKIIEATVTPTVKPTGNRTAQLAEIITKKTGTVEAPKGTQEAQPVEEDGLQNQLNQAQAEGALAHMDQLPDSSNPYGSGPMAEAWLDGWRSEAAAAMGTEVAE